MAYLIALIPALGWGFMPIITGKIGGSSANQIFGIGAGASIIGILAFLVMHPHVSATAFIFSLVCGALWSTGQVGQFESFKRMGVSKTIPLSTVFQLVGNSIIGALFLGQWAGAHALMIGFFALLIVVIGARCPHISIVPSEVHYGFCHQEASQAHGEEEAPQAPSQDASPASQQEVSPVLAPEAPVRRGFRVPGSRVGSV